MLKLYSTRRAVSTQNCRRRPFLFNRPRKAVGALRDRSFAYVRDQNLDFYTCKRPHSIRVSASPFLLLSFASFSVVYFLLRPIPPHGRARSALLLAGFQSAETARSEVAERGQRVSFRDSLFRSLTDESSSGGEKKEKEKESVVSGLSQPPGESKTECLRIGHIERGKCFL